MRMMGAGGQSGEIKKQRQMGRLQMFSSSERINRKRADLRKDEATFLIQDGQQ